MENCFRISCKRQIIQVNGSFKILFREYFDGHFFFRELELSKFWIWKMCETMLRRWNKDGLSIEVFSIHSCILPLYSSFLLVKRIETIPTAYWLFFLTFQLHIYILNTSIWIRYTLKPDNCDRYYVMQIKAFVGPARELFLFINFFQKWNVYRTS